MFLLIREWLSRTSLFCFVYFNHWLCLTSVNIFSGKKNFATFWWCVKASEHSCLGRSYIGVLVQKICSMAAGVVYYS